MNYKEIYLYVISFLSGIFINQYILSGFFPLFLVLLAPQNGLLIFIFFFFGLTWYKICIKSFLMFGIFNGFVDYKSKTHIYVSNISSYMSKNIPNTLVLKYKPEEKIETGEQIKFHCMYFPSNYGKINKIYKRSKGKLTFIQEIRESLNEFFNKSKWFFFLKAIILGDKSEFSSENIEKLKHSGYWHLIVISGLHMNLVMFGIFFILTKLLSLSFRLNYFTDTYFLATIIAILCGIFYLKVSLYSISSMRAFLMTSVSLISQRQIKSYKTLLLLAFIFLLFNPYLAFDMSFQLSFLCTFILLNNFSILFLHLAILMIIPQFNLVSIFTNLIVLPLFSIILFLVMIASILKSIFLIYIIDFLCNIMFKIIFLANYVVLVEFTNLLHLIFIFLVNISLYYQHSIFVYLGFTLLIYFNYILKL